MAEAGGPTTQSGIFYQNSIAALYLGRLIDPARSNSDRIESVRVEAPSPVDDIVITYACGKKEYIQVKEKISSGEKAWTKLWSDFYDQFQECKLSGDSFSLSLVISDASNPHQSLKELCERAEGKNNPTEWRDSLSKKHLNIVDAIEKKSDGIIRR